MKMVEYQHRNEGGGNSVLLDNDTWEHGELVVILSERELRDFVGKTLLVIQEMTPGVRNLAFQHLQELNEVSCLLEEMQKKLK
jgi:hypothetical protein